MFNRIGLSMQIYAILIALVCISIAGGLVMGWYTYRIERRLSAIVDKNLIAYKTAETLETALVNQKGFVSYYCLDGNADWLRRLGEYRQIFKERLKEAHVLVETELQEGTVDLIDSEYTVYVTFHDRVIEHYKNGEREAGAKLHQKVRKRFFKILKLCEEYKNIHLAKIMRANKEGHTQAGKLRIITWVAMLGSLFLGLFLLSIFANRIFSPVRKLTQEADRESGFHKPGNEIKALSRSVHRLINEADRVQIELKQSRENLLQAEKMVLVGELAAGMAHSIRNPLTSVNMRLFSLDRNLELTSTQKEDFEVISEEIRHIDTIVQNFLEFSRPPKLKMQRISPSVVVDLVIQLLEHRLKSYDVSVRIICKRPLPEIKADPEQLKEALVNLIVNACEAMDKGGLITILEEEAYVEPLKRAAVIRLNDNGHGIPESIKGKIFQPFFTTKEKGTGLGLSIASRIIEEHRGWLDVISNELEGTTFIITLPITGPNLEQNSHY